MRTYFKNANEWLKKVQRGNEAKKKRWLILISGVSMLFVVLLWLVYMNISIPALGKPAGGTGEEEKNGPPPSERADGGVEKQESFFEVLGKGFEVFGRNIQEQIAKTKGGIQNILQKADERINAPNEFSVEGEE
ncbi:MAG: hypothetical protein Q8P01_03825 [bacterium]|nr:hypothetical protein [bacterium]